MGALGSSCHVGPRPPSSVACGATRGEPRGCSGLTGAGGRGAECSCTAANLSLSTHPGHIMPRAPRHRRDHRMSLLRARHTRMLFKGHVERKK